MITEFLNLGEQPLANAYSAEPNSPKVYTLKVGFDEETKMVRLMESPPPSAIFTNTYPYNSSHSPFLVSHFKNIAEQIQEKYKPLKVLEIGTNSLPFLSNFDPKSSIGIEPCKNFAEYGRGLGYTIYDDFWDMKTAEKLIENHGKFDLVYSANCMCHIPNLTEAFQAVDHVLSTNGIFIFEDPSIVDVLRYTAFSQFYDEHVSLFSVISLCNEIWSNTKMEVFDVEHLSIHGGSNRIFVKKKDNTTTASQSTLNHIIDTEAWWGINRLETYIDFAKRVEKAKESLWEWLNYLNNNDKKIIGYSCPSKTTTVMNYCGITSKQIPYFIDTIPEKHNKYIPGTDIPILPYTEDWHKDCRYAYLGAYNFAEQIINKEKSFKNKFGRFLTETPTVRLI